MNFSWYSWDIWWYLICHRINLRMINCVPLPSLGLLFAETLLLLYQRLQTWCKPEALHELQTPCYFVEMPDLAYNLAEFRATNHPIYRQRCQVGTVTNPQFALRPWGSVHFAGDRTPDAGGSPQWLSVLPNQSCCRFFVVFCVKQISDVKLEATKTHKKNSTKPCPASFSSALSNETRLLQVRAVSDTWIRSWRSALSRSHNSLAWQLVEIRKHVK